MRRPLLLAPLLAFLIGCPPDDGAVPTAFPTGAAPAPTATEAASGGTPTEASPAAEAPKRKDRPAEDVHVCLLLAKSGDGKEHGAEMRRGMQLAQEQIAAESWRTRTIRWREKDTKSTEVGANTAFVDCNSSGVPVVIGPVHPVAKTALIPVAAAHDGLLVVPEITSAAITVWNDRIVAIAPSSTEMGRTAATDVVAKGHKFAAVLAAQGGFGKAVGSAFSEGFKTDGHSIVATSALDPDKPDAWVAAAKAAVLEKQASALFVVGPGGTAQEVVAVLDDNGMNHVHVWMIDWAMFPPVLDTAAGNTALQRVHWVNRRDPKGDFASEFLERYQSRPRYEAGAGYDAVRLVANAIEEAETAKYEDIGAVLRTLKDVPSAFGTGSMVTEGGVTWLDVAGYGLVAPEPDPDSGNDGFLFGPAR